MNGYIQIILVLQILWNISLGRVCKSDEYLSQNYICKKCDSSCSTCFGGTNQDCFECNGYMYQSQCSQECPTNYFQQETSKICETCFIAYCEKCLNSKQCEKCDSNFYLSTKKDQCINKQQSERQALYAYFDIKEQKLFQNLESCPNTLETSPQTFTCTYPNICSQQNYISEFHSNCFNTDQGGLRVASGDKYTYYYTTKEVYIFMNTGAYEFLYYLQSLNNDKDIQTLIIHSGIVYVIYNTQILCYLDGNSQLLEAIFMPKQISNNKYTLIQSPNLESNSHTYLITISLSLQDSKSNLSYHNYYFFLSIVKQLFLSLNQIITSTYLINKYLVYAFDLDSRSIVCQFQVGQKISQFYIVGEKKQLYIITILRISIYESYYQIGDSKNLEIGEEKQVNWIRSYWQRWSKYSQNVIFAVFNGWSVLLYNSIDNTLIQIEVENENGYLLKQSNLLAIVRKDKIQFADIMQLYKECALDKFCLDSQPLLIKWSLPKQANQEYLIEQMNDNQIYIAVKDSFEVSVYDKNFQLSNIFFNFLKPVKKFYKYKSILSSKEKRHLVITHDNNAKIFTEDKVSWDLFKFCNEKSMELLNKDLKQFGGFVKDERRDILIYVGVNIQGNIVILMMRDDVILFWKELRDQRISGISIESKFKLELNEEKRIIKILGLQQNQYQLVISVQYFSFIVLDNIEKYYYIQSVLRNSLLLASQNKDDPICVYQFQIDSQQSIKITCLAEQLKQIKVNDICVAITYQNANYIELFLKRDQSQQYEKLQQILPISEFQIEFLDAYSILVLAIGNFYKLSLPKIPISIVEEFPNKLTGRIVQYEIDQSNSWMLLKVLSDSVYYFYFFDLLSNNSITQVNDQIKPMAAYDKAGAVWEQYTGQVCTFFIMKSSFSNTSYFQIISSDIASVYGGQQTYYNNVVSYKVVSNSRFDLSGTKQIIQFIKADDQKIVEGCYSVSKLLFYNQLNIKEQINVLCNHKCEAGGQIEDDQLLYQRWYLPNMIKELSIDKIFFTDYYKNTMYSERWHILAMEAYFDSKKQVIPSRIEIIQYPEKTILFSYTIQTLCTIFSFQLTSYDTLLICDSNKIYTFQLAQIVEQYAAQNNLPNSIKNTKNLISVDGNKMSASYKFQLNYPIDIEQIVYFSQIEPYIYLNGYGVYDYQNGQFYEQNELIFFMKGKEKKLQIIEKETYLYYCVDQFVFLYEKSKIKSKELQQQQTVIFLNNSNQIPYLERDFVIGLTQLRQQQQVQIFSYVDFNPIKTFYELEQEEFNSNNYYYYCWQYQKLFLIYENTIVGYDYPFTPVQQPFFVYKTKQNIPRACSNNYLLVYEDTLDYLIIRFINYKDSQTIKQYNILKSVQRISVDLFINQKNVAIIEEKQIIVIGNILLSTSDSDFFMIFQESRFHYSPSLDIAFIHQQALERYIQVLDLSSLFPFIQERFSYETFLSFQNYYKPYSLNEFVIQSSLNRQSDWPGPSSQEDETKEINDDDLIFINLMEKSICFYNTKSKSYKLISLERIQTQGVEEMNKDISMGYRIFVNENNMTKIAIVNFDRMFYLFTRNSFVKILSLQEYEQVHVETKQNQIFIYALKEFQLYYITINNSIQDFIITKIELNNFNLDKIILIARQINQKFAILDSNNKLVVNKSVTESCEIINDSQLKDGIKEIRIQQLEFLPVLNNNNGDEKIIYDLILVSKKDQFLIYDLNCNILYMRTDLDYKNLNVLFDNVTQQVFLADKYFIYIIGYNQIISSDKTFSEKQNQVIGSIPLQTRGKLKLVKVNESLLAILSYSNVYIYSVKQSFTAMFYISNKEFSYLKQIFLIQNEFFVISDANNLYIYQIISDENTVSTSKLIKSRNSLIGTSSFSSTSNYSNNGNNASNPFIDSSDSSEYYSKKLFSIRKQSVLLFSQRNIHIEILSLELIFQDERLFLRILGADYNNIIDFTKELKIFNKHILSSSNQLNYSDEELEEILSLDQQQSTSFQIDQQKLILLSISCRGEQVIHQKKSYQIILYDTLFSQNSGLYNQIIFKYPEDQSSSISDLFIPNSLKLTPKKQTQFIFDLNNNRVLLQPSIIMSSFISKIKIYSGIIEDTHQFEVSTTDDGVRRLLNQNKNEHKKIDDEEIQNNGKRFKNINSKRNLQQEQENTSNEKNKQITIKNFEEVHFSNVELRESLNFLNCSKIILENIVINFDDKNSEKILLSFEYGSNIQQSSLFIRNITINASILTSPLMVIKNVYEVNITDLKVVGKISNIVNQQEFYEYSQTKWIYILQCYNVVINELKFTNSNSNIDLFYLQDIQDLSINNTEFHNHSNGFAYQENRQGLLLKDLINQNDNNNNDDLIGIEVLSQQTDKEQLSYFINIPMEINKYSSVFEIIYVKNNLEISNISVFDSRLSNLLHFNKTIIIDSLQNQQIKEQYESIRLKIQIQNIKIKGLSELQNLPCLNHDLIIIEGLKVSMSNFNFFNVSCYQSLIRCIACQSFTIGDIIFNQTHSINFPIYMFKNDKVLMNSVNFFQSQNLQHFVGIINSPYVEMNEINSYPSQDAKILKFGEDDILNNEIKPSELRNCALLIYFEQFNPNSLESQQQNLQEVSLVKISSSTLQFMKTNNCNGTAMQIYNYHSVELSNVRLYNNVAGQNGGAIYLSFTQLILINSEIAFNKAILSGGAIYSLSSDVIIKDLTNFSPIILSAIHHNQASIGGGIRYFNSNLDIIKNHSSAIYSNKANYFGRDYANYPSKFLLLDIEKTKTIKDVVSSISAVQTQINYYWVDEQGDRLLYENPKINIDQDQYYTLRKEMAQYTSVYLSSKNIWINRLNTDVKIEGDIMYDKNQNQFIQISQSFLLKPKKESFITIKAIINYPEIDNQFILNDIKLSKEIKLSFRECIRGEVFNSFNSDSYECLECKDNTYSLDLPNSFDSKCLLCPDEAKKCSKNIIEIYEGFWIQPQTSNIYQCLNNPQKCQPKQRNGCSEGGYGPRCESCDYKGEIWDGIKFGRYGRYECQKCNDEKNGQILGVTILIIILFTIFLGFLVNQLTVYTHSTLIGNYLKRSGLINMGSSIDGIGANSLIRFILGYFQIIQVLTSFDFKFSQHFLNFIFFFGNPLQISHFILDCFFIDKNWIQSLDIVYIRMIWSLVNTLIYLIILLLFSALYLILSKNTHSSKTQTFFRYARSSIYYVYYMIFPSIVSECIKILSCENIGGKKYIYEDNQFECDSSQHLWFGNGVCLSILLLIGGFPLYIFYQMKKNFKILYKPSLYLKFHFFFSDYKRSNYYWELVKMVQKALIYIGLSIYNQNQIAKGAIVSLIMTIYIRYIYIIKPYKRIFLNQIDFAASFCLLICFQIGMINTATNNLSIQNFSFYWIISCNVLFYLYFISKVFKEKISYSKSMLTFSFIEFITKKFPFLKKYFHRSDGVFISHKAWLKLRSTIKRIGYQNLPLYLPALQNLNSPSIIYGMPTAQQNIFIPTHHQYQQQKKIGQIEDFTPGRQGLNLEHVGSRRNFSLQQNYLNGLESAKRQGLSDRNQFFSSTELNGMNKVQLQKSEEYELQLIEPIEGSQFLQIPDENVQEKIFPQLQFATVQKLMSQYHMPSVNRLDQKSNLKKSPFSE